MWFKGTAPGRKSGDLTFKFQLRIIGMLICSKMLSTKSRFSGVDTWGGLLDLETRGQEFCIALGPVTICVKVKVFPLQAMKAHGGCGCKGQHIHSHGTRKR